MTTLMKKSFNDPDEVKTPEKTHAATVNFGTVAATKIVAHKEVKPIVQSAILVSMLTMVVSGIPQVLADEGLQITPAAGQEETEYCEYLGDDAMLKIKGFSVAADNSQISSCRQLKSCTLIIKGKKERASGCITVRSSGQIIKCLSRCKDSCEPVRRASSRGGNIIIRD